jgi:nitronate monooxygenase
MHSPARRPLVDQLEHPIVQAPLGGGPSTPRLAAAVAEAGGLGFLAAGCKTVEAVRADLDEVRGLTGRAIGINLFAPPGPAPDAAAVERYASELRDEAVRYGVETGEARHHDDAYAVKFDLVVEERVRVVSFTFGCPAREDVERLHDAGGEAWVTVTTPGEAAEAVAAGHDAGFHRSAGAGDREPVHARARSAGAARVSGRAPRDRATARGRA